MTKTHVEPMSDTSIGIEELPRATAPFDAGLAMAFYSATLATLALFTRR